MVGAVETTSQTQRNATHKPAGAQPQARQRQPTPAGRKKKFFTNGGGGEGGRSFKSIPPNTPCFDVTMGFWLACRYWACNCRVCAIGIARNRPLLLGPRNCIWILDRIEGKGKVICMHACIFFFFFLLPTFLSSRWASRMDRYRPVIRRFASFLLGVFNRSRQNQPGCLHLFFFTHFDWHHHSNVGEPKRLVMLESTLLALEKPHATCIMKKESHTTTASLREKKPKSNAVAPNYEGQDSTIHD